MLWLSALLPSKSPKRPPALLFLYALSRVAGPKAESVSAGMKAA